MLALAFLGLRRLPLSFSMHSPGISHFCHLETLSCLVLHQVSPTPTLSVLPAHVPVGRRATQASRGAGVETENPMPVLHACICLQNLFHRHVKAFKNVTKCPFSIL